MSRNQTIKASQKPKKNFYASAKSGFTLVELSLSLAFIGVLLIIITIITINITSIYQKGLALKAVNSVGRSLVDEFTDALKLAPRANASTLCSRFTDTTGKGDCEADRAQKFVFQERMADSTSRLYANQQLGGVFCTGYYSYIWNTAQGINAGATLSLSYKDKDGNDHIISGDRIHLLRIEDRESQVCASQIGSNYNQNKFDENRTGNYTIDIRKKPVLGGVDPDEDYDIPTDPVEDFLKAFDMPLELYNLTLFPIARNSVNLHSFMTGTFILATARGGINIGRSGDYCQVNNASELIDPNSDYEGGNMQSLSSDFNYCAINKFNFAARASGQD